MWMKASRGLVLALLLSGLSHGALAAPSLDKKADRIVVEKSAHRMTLYRGDKVIRYYEVALGRGGGGPKQREGDALTPEGTYRVVHHKADSAFHRALRLSYPEPDDIKRAARQGVPPGSDIMIHGMRNGFGWLAPFNTWFDWTNGCVAVTNSEMDEIWLLVEDGTPVEIKH